MTEKSPGLAARGILSLRSDWPRCLLPPPFEHGEELVHLGLGLLLGHAGVGLDHHGGAEVDHLLHGHLPRELAALVAVAAVVRVLGAVRLGAKLHAGGEHAPYGLGYTRATMVLTE